MTRVLEPGLKLLMWLSMGKKYTNDILLKGIYTRTRKQCSLMQLNSYAISTINLWQSIQEKFNYNIHWISNLTIRNVNLHNNFIF